MRPAARDALLMRQFRGRTKAYGLLVRLAEDMSQANNVAPPRRAGRLERGGAQHPGYGLGFRRALTAGAAWLPLPLGYAAAGAGRDQGVVAVHGAGATVVVGCARTLGVRAGGGGACGLGAALAVRGRARARPSPRPRRSRGQRAGVFAPARGRANAAHARRDRRRGRARWQARARARRAHHHPSRAWGECGFGARLGGPFGARGAAAARSANRPWSRCRACCSAQTTSSCFRESRARA